MMNKEEFIKQLTQDLGPQRPWLPVRRTVQWFVLAIIVNAAVIAWVQSFRQNFVFHLQTYPRLTLEIAFGLVLTLVFIYWFFSSFIPGYKFSRTARLGGAISLVGLALSVGLSFFMASPPAGTLGARPYCLEEVVLYGTLGMMVFAVSTRKIDYDVSRLKYGMIGLSAGLVPALLMQMACMYGPTHALVAHYGPLLILGALSMGLPAVRGWAKGIALQGRTKP